MRLRPRAADEGDWFARRHLTRADETGRMQPHPDLETEQAHLDLAYTRLDALRALARTRLETAMRQGNEGTHQNRSERDSFTSLYTDRLAALDAVESRLAFGRPDTDDGPDLDRPHRAVRRRPAARCCRLAGARGGGVLPGHRRAPAGRRPAPAHRHRAAARSPALDDEVLDPEASAADGGGRSGRRPAKAR